MSSIILMRGLPASGKSTWAKWIARRNPDTVRVSRDDIRSQLYPGADYRDIDEDLVTEVETATARAALRNGKMVIVDAMHLQQRYVNRWQRLGYPVEIAEFHEPLDTLLERNRQRPFEDTVPEEVIRKNFQKFTNKDGSLRKVTLNPDQYLIDYKYVPDNTLPEAFIFDIDGSLSHNDGHRSFYDYSKVYADTVHNHVASVCNDVGTSHHVLIVSGREDSCRGETERWLRDNNIRYDELYMRSSGDNRADTIVKMEILRDKIAPEFEVIAAIDDRPSVCEMWRKVGVPTFQVGDPDNRF